MNYPDRDEIRTLCTNRSFKRGRNYYQRGRILELSVGDGEITATVRGSHDYYVTVDVDEDAIRTSCSCPYDFPGDCKHVVAVLLAVDDRDDPTVGSEKSDDPGEKEDEGPDVEELVGRTSPAVLRSFLVEILGDDRDLRDRFVAFAGEDTGKEVADYRAEIDGLFVDEAGKGGLIDWQARIDFSQYRDLADTFRERGDVDAATDVYRALAEGIRANLDRVDDSTGYYGRQVEGAVEAYAETVREADLGHEDKRPHLEYLFGGFVSAEYEFVRQFYDGALRTVCTTTADLECWLDQLAPYGPGFVVEIDRTADGDRTVNVATTDPRSSSERSNSDPDLRTRSVLSTFVHLLEKLDEPEALREVSETCYLENRRICQEYASRLQERGKEERAIEVVEDGLEEFGRTASLRWLAVDLYRGRRPEAHRQTLKRLFLDDREWDAYDELKEVCDESEWPSMYGEIVPYLEENDRRRLIDLLVFEGEFDRAFDEVIEGEKLRWFLAFASPLGGVGPETYFEAYREQLVPLAARKTGRSHYKKIAKHLDGMEQFLSEERLEEFVDFLKEKHSNRPAFLDELRKAGY